MLVLILNTLIALPQIFAGVEKAIAAINGILRQLEVRREINKVAATEAEIQYAFEKAHNKLDAINEKLADK